MKLQTILTDAARGDDYSLLELSRMLDHHPSTLARLIRDGHGPKHSRQGRNGAYRIKAADVLSWLEVCKPVAIGAGPASKRTPRIQAAPSRVTREASTIHASA